ncbi:hypothetical protein [Deinococcus hopiensis]|uniref:hypothetical protein n=1 Tax=Deinococcus hopiensis TaxID=309885 RepID=UPI00111C3847|nr:hypothetical protein [Deinococcus hopiensis]
MLPGAERALGQAQKWAGKESTVQVAKSLADDAEVRPGIRPAPGITREFGGRLRELGPGRYFAMVFIDERFDSLDPEALDLAMDCLTQLQDSGRLVGVTSQVQELQQHIPAQLEITPSP